MIVNGYSLLSVSPIVDMESTKVTRNGVTFGLGEAGYDIRIKQTVHFRPRYTGGMSVTVDGVHYMGHFCLASALEVFQMPCDLVGIVHDKSTWARRGLSVFNTVIEPGFRGGLTLELVYHGEQELEIPAGSGIAQVVFHRTACEARYSGKYQNQSTDPEPARMR